MKQYLNKYFESIERNKKSNTIKMIRHILEDFFDYVGDNPVDVDIINNWQASKKAQKTTRKQYVGVIRGYIEWCINRDYHTGKNYAKVVLEEMGKADDRNPNKRKMFTLEEIRSMIKATNNPRDRCILLLLAKTGIRANELCEGLKIQNIDFNNGFIKVVNRKNDQNHSKDTVIPMDDELANALKYWKAIRGNIPSDDLFVTYNNTSMSKINLWTIVHETGERIGIQDGHPHCFRHFFTDTLMTAGMKEIFVEYLRGDKKMKMTSHYSHPEKNIEAIKAEYLRFMPNISV